MPATSRKTSSTVKTLRGKTASNNLQPCEIISAAAFFNRNLQVPEKAVGQHTREHVMMPSWVFAYWVQARAMRPASQPSQTTGRKAGVPLHAQIRQWVT